MSHQRALAEELPRSNWKHGKNGWRNERDYRHIEQSGQAGQTGYTGHARPIGQTWQRGQTGQAAHRQVRSRLSKPVAIAVLAVGLYLFTGYLSGFVKIASLYHQIARTRHEIVNVQEKNKELQKRIAELNSPAYAEKVARETLGLIKKGEVKYLVAEPMDKQDPAYLEVQKRHDSDKVDNFY